MWMLMGAFRMMFKFITNLIFHLTWWFYVTSLSPSLRREAYELLFITSRLWYALSRPARAKIKMAIKGSEKLWRRESWRRWRNVKAIGWRHLSPPRETFLPHRTHSAEWGKRWSLWASQNSLPVSIFIYFFWLSLIYYQLMIWMWNFHLLLYWCSTLDL